MESYFSKSTDLVALAGELAVLSVIAGVMVFWVFFPILIHFQLRAMHRTLKDHRLDHAVRVRNIGMKVRNNGVRVSVAKDNDPGYDEKVNPSHP